MKVHHGSKHCFFSYKISLKHITKEMKILKKTLNSNIGNDFFCLSCFSITRHISSVHEGKKTFKCSICDFKGAQKGNLTMHIESVHDGVRYPCNQCNYRATRKNSLKLHKATIHSNIHYSWDKCDYTTKFMGNLHTHTKNYHSIS